MTQVLVDLRKIDPEAGTDVSASGSIRVAAVNRYHVHGADDHIVVRDWTEHELVDGKVTLILPPSVPVGTTSGPQAYAFQEILDTPDSAFGYFLVPDTTSVPYADLTAVSWPSLQPDAVPEDAWWIALDEVAQGTIPDEVIEQAIEEYLAENPIDAVTQAELDAAIEGVELTPGPPGDDGAPGAPGTDGLDGLDGLGWTGGSYNPATGVVTFTSDDGLGFSTGDLRGADGVDGAQGSPGADGAEGPQGPPGEAGADGADGAQGPAGADATAADIADGDLTIAKTAGLQTALDGKVGGNGTITSIIAVTESEYAALTPDPETLYAVTAD